MPMRADPRPRPLRGRAAITATVTAALLFPASSASAAPSAVDPAGVPDAAGSGSLPLRGLDLDALTIPDLQQRMDGGALSSVDLTTAYLDRIDALNDELGAAALPPPYLARMNALNASRRAVLSVTPDALEDAGASDEARQRRPARSPLEGIPVRLKNKVDTEQMPTTAGSRALLGSTPDD